MRKFMFIAFVIGAVSCTTTKQQTPERPSRPGITAERATPGPGEVAHWVAGDSVHLELGAQWVVVPPGADAQHMLDSVIDAGRITLFGDSLRFQGQSFQIDSIRKQIGNKNFKQFLKENGLKLQKNN